jgi:hypothetical protein
MAGHSQSPVGFLARTWAMQKDFLNNTFNLEGATSFTIVYDPFLK